MPVFMIIIILSIYLFIFSGLFVRCMILAFEQLSFSQVCNLHQKYCSFYEAWEKARKHNIGNIAEADASQLGDASLSILDIMDEGQDVVKKPARYWYLTHLPLDKMAANFAKDIFKCIFMNEKFCISILISNF